MAYGSGISVMKKNDGNDIEAKIRKCNGGRRIIALLGMSIAKISSSGMKPQQYHGEKNWRYL